MNLADDYGDYWDENYPRMRVVYCLWLSGFRRGQLKKSGIKPTTLAIALCVEAERDLRAFRFHEQHERKLEARDFVALLSIRDQIAALADDGADNPPDEKARNCQR